MRQSNYEITRDQMRVRFLDYDQEKIIRKFCLQADDTWLYIWFLGRNYRIGRNNGVVEWSDNSFLTSVPGNFNESMTIYDLLCCSKDDCCLSGVFSPANSLKGVVYMGHSDGSGLTFKGNWSYFDHHTEQLHLACRQLNGVAYGQGDVAYRVPVFDFLPVLFQFWCSDEDFPAQVKLLWDQNVLSYLHYETLWYAANHLIQRLCETMKDMEQTQS